MIIWIVEYVDRPPVFLGAFSSEATAKAAVETYCAEAQWSSSMRDYNIRQVTLDAM